MINWSLVSPRNVVVITTMILIWTVLLGPVFNMVGKVSGSGEDATA